MEKHNYREAGLSENRILMWIIRKYSISQIRGGHGIRQGASVRDKVEGGWKLKVKKYPPTDYFNR